MVCVMVIIKKYHHWGFATMLSWDYMVDEFVIRKKNGVPTNKSFSVKYWGRGIIYSGTLHMKDVPLPVRCWVYVSNAHITLICFALLCSYIVSHYCSCVETFLSRFAFWTLFCVWGFWCKGLWEQLTAVPRVWPRSNVVLPTCTTMNPNCLKGHKQFDKIKHHSSHGIVSTLASKAH